MRRHHEELAAASALVPALSALIPIGVALWVRISALGQKPASGEGLVQSEE